MLRSSEIAADNRGTDAAPLQREALIPAGPKPACSVDTPLPRRRHPSVCCRHRGRAAAGACGRAASPEVYQQQTGATIAAPTLKRDSLAFTSPELSCCSGSGQISDGKAEKLLRLHPKRLNKHLSQHAASIFTDSRRHGWSRRSLRSSGTEERRRDAPPGEGSRDGNDTQYQSQRCFQQNLLTAIRPDSQHAGGTSPRTKQT